jgi:Protein of unknown function (DUF3568)
MGTFFCHRKKSSCEKKQYPFRFSRVQVKRALTTKNHTVIITKIFLGMFLAAVLALGSGCALFVVGAVAGAGVGTYAYVDGELKSTEAVSYETACTATLAGLKDLGFVIGENKKDASMDKITARSTTNKVVYVILARQSATSTEIRIRVGTFGDQTLSQQILEKIRSHF